MKSITAYLDWEQQLVFVASKVSSRKRYRNCFAIVFNVFNGSPEIILSCIGFIS